MTRNDLLVAFVSHYRTTSRERLSDAYVDQLRNAVRLLDRYFGSPVKLADLTDELLNGFVDWLTELGRRPETVRGRRNSVLCLWREAFQQRILDIEPRRIRRIRSRRRLPEAWTQQEVALLIHTALNDRKTLRNGVSRGLWFGSLFAAGWDTALRLGDLLRFPRRLVSAGPVLVTQHKTGDDILVRFSPETLDLLEQLSRQTGTELVWPLWAGQVQVYRYVRILRDRAGIGRGSFKWLRRGSITAVESAGGDGTRHAGHRSRDVTVRHYIDPTQTQNLRTMPPTWKGCNATDSGFRTGHENAKTGEHV